MDCKEAVSLIGALIDGEISVTEEARVREHLAACQECAREEERQRSLSGAIRKVGALRAPESLRTSWIPPETSSEKILVPTRRLDLFWPVVAAACLAIGVLLGRLTLGRPGIENELVTSHIRSLLANHLIDVQSSDRHTVKPWFDGKVDFSATPYDLASAGFPLAGGRLDYVDGKPTPVFVYKRRLHIINLYVFHGAPPLSPTEARGYRVVPWRQGELTYAAISDVSAEDLEEFHRDFEKQR